MAEPIEELPNASEFMARAAQRRRREIVVLPFILLSLGFVATIVGTFFVQGSLPHRVLGGTLAASFLLSLAPVFDAAWKALRGRHSPKD